MKQREHKSSQSNRSPQARTEVIKIFRPNAKTSLKVSLIISLGILCQLLLTHQDRFLLTQPEELNAKSLVSVDDYELAKLESGGFFDDIPTKNWKLIKERVAHFYPNCNKEWVLKDRRNQKSGFFYQASYEPDFACQHEWRIGKGGDGGKWICDPHRIAAQDKCLVYSVGCNNEFSFEMDVRKTIGEHCEIHSFDRKTWPESGPDIGINYHQWFIAEKDGPQKKSLKTIVEELGHQNRTIDIFKIDCEGCEWDTISSLFEAGVTLRQIQIELHGAPLPKTLVFFEKMYEHNYVIFHKEPNIAFSGGAGDFAMEYAFIKLSPEFFADFKDKEVQT